MSNPDVITIDIGPLSCVHNGQPVEISRVGLSKRSRLRFLLSGEVTLFSLPDEGFRVELRTPRFRQLPLILLDKLLPKDE